MSLCLLRDPPDFRPPGSSFALWDPLDGILSDLAGKYQPRYEGDKMVVDLVDVNPDISGAVDFPWRYRGRELGE